jgi:integrase
MRAMLQLTWDRVDLRAGRMWIPGDQQKNAEPHGLPIAPKVAKLLRQLKTLNPEGNAVFQWKGKPVDDCNGHAFKKAVARSGIGYLRWHDLRHTFASWALQNGVTLPELKELGAWKSFDQVLEYAHLAPDHLALAAAKIGTNRTQRKTARRSSG